MAIIKMTESEFHNHVEEYNGVCLACGAIRYGSTEPDAENYPCEDCGKRKVRGIENALVCGNIEIVDESRAEGYGD